MAKNNREARKLLQQADLPSKILPVEKIVDRAIISQINEAGENQEPNNETILQFVEASSAYVSFETLVAACNFRFA